MPDTDHTKVREATEHTTTCEILAELAERVTLADQTGGHLAAALVRLQADLPVVPKNQTAKIPMSGGGSYSYAYADLGDVARALQPLLAKHGLAFTCLPRRVDSGYEAVGRLVHTSGQYVEGSLPLIGRTAQEHGSSLTYNRRYLLGCLTGVITDTDDDGSLAQAAQEARASVDRGPAAATLWARAQEATNLQAVQALWAEANAKGLLEVDIDHMDGDPEPLGAALKRYGDVLQGQTA
jgi:hypothetical protein